MRHYDSNQFTSILEQIYLCALHNRGQNYCGGDQWRPIIIFIFWSHNDFIGRWVTVWHHIISVSSSNSHKYSSGSHFHFLKKRFKSFEINQSFPIKRNIHWTGAKNQTVIIVSYFLWERTLNHGLIIFYIDR